MLEDTQLRGGLKSGRVVTGLLDGGRGHGRRRAGTVVHHHEVLPVLVEQRLLLGFLLAACVQRRQQAARREPKNEFAEGEGGGDEVPAWKRVRWPAGRRRAPTSWDRVEVRNAREVILDEEFIVYVLVWC